MQERKRQCMSAVIAGSFVKLFLALTEKPKITMNVEQGRPANRQLSPVIYTVYIVVGVALLGAVEYAHS